jgi:hypothetical protein
VPEKYGVISVTMIPKMISVYFDSLRNFNGGMPWTFAKNLGKFSLILITRNVCFEVMDFSS